MSKVEQEPIAYMTEDGRVSMAETVNTAMPRAAKESFYIPLYDKPFNTENLQKENNELKDLLNIQTKAANHWMHESCKDHNSMMALKEAAKLALDALDAIPQVDSDCDEQTQQEYDFVEEAIEALKKVLED